MEETTKALASALAKVSKSAEDAQARLKAVDKLLVDPDKNAFAIPGAARDAIKALEATNEALAAATEARVWLESTAQRAANLQERIKARLAGALSSALEHKGIHVSGHMPELQCGLLTVEMQFDAAKARVWWGPKLEELSRVELEPDGVAAAVVGELERLHTEGWDDAAFHAQLREAWRVAAVRRAELAEPGWAAPIMAIFREVAWLRQGESFFAQPTRARFHDYSTVQFAYDLFRMRERVVNGWELRLNVATREQTRKRGESLWIPRNARGEGTHFASLTMRRVNEGER